MATAKSVGPELEENRQPPTTPPPSRCALSRVFDTVTSVASTTIIVLVISAILVTPTSARTIQTLVHLPEATVTTTTKKQLKLKKLISFKVKK